MENVYKSKSMTNDDDYIHLLYLNGCNNDNNNLISKLMLLSYGKFGKNTTLNGTV